MVYDFSKWHAGCKSRGLIAGDRPMIFCMDCGVLADLEAVSQKITAYSSNKGIDNVPAGQMSKEVKV